MTPSIQTLVGFNARSLLQLVVLAVALGAVWRVEVEVHGWEGLIWISYFHWAVPLGAAAFLVWVVMSPNAPSGPRRGLLVAVGAVYATVALYAVSVVLNTIFYSGPLEIIWGTNSLDWIERIAVGAVLGVPLGAFVLARICGARLSWWSLPLSLALSVAAGPAAVCLLRVIEPAHADDIHAVKTGAAVPFVVLALGVPWAARPSSRRSRGLAGLSDRVREPHS